MKRSDLFGVLLDSLIAESFGSLLSGVSSGRRNDNVYSFDMPGVEKKNVKVKTQTHPVYGHVALIEATRTDTDGEINRAFAIDRELDPDTCEAALTNGVLTLTFAKRKVAETKEKEIEIK